MNQRLVKLAASFVYVGFFPFAPGTLGSLGGCALMWFLSGKLQWILAVLIVIGFLICKQSQEFFASKDPQSFVLDEVCGCGLALIGLPKNPALFLMAFILFRAFDIIKPWPISKIQDSKHPHSIMWDDILAGIFANGVIQFFIHSGFISPNFFCCRAA